MPAAGPPDLLVGLAQPDDAAVHRLGDGRALIVSLDFFTPIVDDPFDYGQIAAANALSDIYAMGGTPFLALSIAAFPDDLPVEILTRIVQGAAAKVHEAGAVIAGGHSVRDAEPKFGLAVLGFAQENELILKGGARPGDYLYLTKPIGAGVISTALKNERADAADVAAAVASMTQLSARASRAARAAGVRGGTDVTGFSLAGHALEMADAAKARLSIHWPSVPLLPGAVEAARAGFIPGGALANREAFSTRTEGLAALDEAETALLFDPQTSGGLLLAVPRDAERRFLDAASAAGASGLRRIGRVEVGAGLLIQV